MNEENKHPCTGCETRNTCKNNKGCVDYLEYSLFKKDCKEKYVVEKRRGQNQRKYDIRKRYAENNKYLNIIGKTFDQALKLNIRLDSFGRIIE